MSIGVLSVSARRGGVGLGWALLVACGLGMSASSARAEQFWLADSNAWPGTIVVRQMSGTPREIFRRPLAAPAGASDAIPRIGAIAPTSDPNVAYVCSGLDRYIFRVEHGRIVHVHTHPAQVRDIAFGESQDVLYYSVLPTPQGDQPVGYGEIFSYHLRTNVQRLEATIQQRDLAGNWWGAFTIRDRAMLIATFDAPSRIYKLTPTGPSEIFSTPGLAIRGFDFNPPGDLLFAASDGAIYRSPDMRTISVAIPAGATRASDIALPR